jgi:hypothetical protein
LLLNFRLKLGQARLDLTVGFAINIPVRFKPRYLLIEARNLIFKPADTALKGLLFARSVDDIITSLDSPEFEDEVSSTDNKYGDSSPGRV